MFDQLYSNKNTKWWVKTKFIQRRKDGLRMPDKAKSVE